MVASSSIRLVALVSMVVASAVFLESARADDDDAAPTSARVSGRVTDVLDKPIAGARIYIVARSTGVEQTLSTDKDGRYDVAVREVGTYTILASHRNVRAAKQIA